MIEIKPPNKLFNNDVQSHMLKIFLAGTIEMGQSEDWQAKLVHELDTIQSNIIIYNPRRDKWDNTLEQKYENPQFYQQVNWELDALDRSDLIIMNLLKDTKSPISLLELGLYASSGKLLVCCDPQFWRRGNVEIVCNRYNIPLFPHIYDLFNYLKVEIIVNKKYKNNEH